MRGHVPGRNEGQLVAQGHHNQGNSWVWLVGSDPVGDGLVDGHQSRHAILNRRSGHDPDRGTFGLTCDISGFHDDSEDEVWVVGRLGRNREEVVPRGASQLAPRVGCGRGRVCDHVGVFGLIRIVETGHAGRPNADHGNRSVVEAGLAGFVAVSEVGIAHTGVLDFDHLLQRGDALRACECGSVVGVEIVSVERPEGSQELDLHGPARREVDDKWNIDAGDVGQSSTSSDDLIVGHRNVQADFFKQIRSVGNYL